MWGWGRSFPRCASRHFCSSPSATRCPPHRKATYPAWPSLCCSRGLRMCCAATWRTRDWAAAVLCPGKYCICIYIGISLFLPKVCSHSFVQLKKILNVAFYVLLNAWLSNCASILFISPFRPVLFHPWSLHNQVFFLCFSFQTTSDWDYLCAESN